MSAPSDPREGRYRPMSRLLRSGLLLAAAAAVATLLLDGPAAEVAGIVMVALLGGIPLLRVTWLAGRWLRRGDPRFAALAILVAAIPLAGYLLGR